MIFATISLSGCQEISKNLGGDEEPSKPNYINVTAELRGYFHKYNEYNTIPIPLANYELKLKIDKAGGLNKICYSQTDESGYTSKCVYSLQLYREQPINMYVSLESDPPKDIQKGKLFEGFVRITWDEIYPETNFGESITISRELGVVGYTYDWEHE
jgi:hypothetical protein